jgi:glucokinase
MNFGGAESPIGRRFLERAVMETRKAVFPDVAKHLIVDFAQLGGNAGFIGAAGLARKATKS